MVVPNMLSISRAKISEGTDMITSTTLPMSWSINPPLVAAHRPAVAPIKKARMVASRAKPTVLRAP